MPLLLSENSTDRNKVHIKSDHTILVLLRLWVLFAIPIWTIVAGFYSTSSRGFSKLIFTVLIFVLAIYTDRALFKNKNEWKTFRLYGDWTLPFAIAAHAGMVTLLICEYFFIGSLTSSFKVKLVSTIIGLATLVLSFSLRLWAKKSLGSQWSIHAIGAQRIRKIRVITIGPYKYVRHPVYLSWVLDALALPLIFNCFLSALFSIFIVSPIYILRALMEERASARRFGLPYFRYMIRVNGFIPNLSTIMEPPRHLKLYKKR